VARTVFASAKHLGEVTVIRHVTEKRLIWVIRDLANQIRNEINQLGFDVYDFSVIAQHYGAKLYWEKMEQEKPGYYLKDESLIVLNNRISSSERLNFTFYHELAHHILEHNDDFLSLFADAYLPTSGNYDLMEKLCNEAAAEILVPYNDLQCVLQEYDFSVSLIPLLSERYNASSIAVAIQMVTHASHDCYLVIAGTRGVENARQLELVIIYSSQSSTVKYSIKRFQVIHHNHLLYKALSCAETPITGEGKLPFASGRGWCVACEAIYYRGRVFAFFNASQPISSKQLPLL
jgi:Zn-dependent peptidase ImmA (M78 family)